MHGTSKLECTLRADSVSLRRTINCDETTAGLQIITGARAAGPNARESWLDEMVHNMKHTESNGDRNRSPSVRSDSPTVDIDKEKFKSLIQSEVKSAVETAREENIRGKVEDTIPDVFITVHCAAMDGVRASTISFVENIYSRKWLSAKFWTGCSIRTVAIGRYLTPSCRCFLEGFSITRAF